MKSRWRAGDDPRERHRHRSRERDPERGRPGPHSPTPTLRREQPDSYRRREPAGPSQGRSHKKWHPSREERKLHDRKPSRSPPRSPRPKHTYPPPGRLPEDRTARPRNFTPARFPKRRRTRSPSPAGSDRFGSESLRLGRDRDHTNSHDRRSRISRSRSPYRGSPPRRPRPDPRSRGPDREPYAAVGSLEHTLPSRRNRRSPSPLASPKPSSSRRIDPIHSTLDSRISPTRSFPPLKCSAIDKGETPAKDSRPASRTPSVAEDIDNHSMDGHYPMRGNYGIHRGQSRPFVDTRQPQFGGSPPYSSNPNSSYHGSPQANSPYHNQRGGWGGAQGQQG